MNYLVLAIFMLIALPEIIMASQTDLTAAAVKEKWMNLANAEVEKAQKDYIEVYLSQQCLAAIDLPEIAELAKQEADRSTVSQLGDWLSNGKKEEFCEAFEKSVQLDTIKISMAPKLLDYVSSKMPESIDTDQTPVEWVETRARQIFNPLPVAILFFLNDTYNLLPLSLYENNMNWLVLNVDKFTQNPEFLEPALLHEHAHFLYQDYLNRVKLQLLAKASNRALQDAHKILNKALLPLQRTTETRADVYAAKQLSNRKPLLAFLQALKLEGDANGREKELTTHPAIAQRIALIEQFDAEILAAELQQVS